MKFCEKLYVGFQRDRYTRSDEPRVLGFAVPYDNTESSKKRQETVNNWANNKEECRIIDNKPTRGFKLLEVATRYRTSNKLFRVLDPRGFELEISADCLLELAQNSTIVKGEIIEECVWAQHHGAWLMPTSSEEYKLWTKQTVRGEKTKIEAGKYYVNVGNMLSIFRFEGIYQHTYLEYSHVADEGKWKETVETTSYYSNKRYSFRIEKYHTNVNIFMNSGNKPTYLYTEFILDSDGNVKRKQIHARKSHFKNLVPYKDELSTEVTEYVLDVMQWVEGERSRYSKEEDDREPTESIHGNKLYDGFFKTKEEAKAFDYSKIITDYLVPKHGYYDSVRVDHIMPNTYGYYSRDNYLASDAKRTFNIKDKR